MKFNSKSVTLNRGVNVMHPVQLPSALTTYNIPEDIWDESIVRFNKELDARSQVSEIVNGIKVDVLRIKRAMGNVILWMTAKEHDVATIEALTFTLKGQLVFENEKSDAVEKLLINDLFCGVLAYGLPNDGMKSIFRKKDLTS